MGPFSYSAKISTLLLQIECPGGGGRRVLTGLWYTGMPKGLRVLFRHIWNINGWVSVSDPMQNWVYFGKFGKKVPNLFQVGCFFMAIWYSDGSQNHASRGKEVFEILKSTLSIPVQNFLKTTPTELNARNNPHPDISRQISSMLTNMDTLHLSKTVGLYCTSEQTRNDKILNIY